MNRYNLIIESNSLKTRILMVGMIVFGLFLISIAPKSLSHIEVFQRSFNTIFVMGLFIAGSGFLGLTWVEDVKIFKINDSLILNRKNIFRSKEQRYPLKDIQKIHTATVGRAQSPHSYHLMIYLNTGVTIQTGRWSWNQNEIIAEAEQLGEHLHSASTSGLVVHPIQRDLEVANFQIPQIGMAFGLAVLMYVLWYRFQVGPWCFAMWSGSAPLVIILGGTVLFISLLRRIPK